jgi:hypothetical protein
MHLVCYVYEAYHDEQSLEHKVYQPAVHKEEKYLPKRSKLHS